MTEVDDAAAGQPFTFSGAFGSHLAYFVLLFRSSEKFLLPEPHSSKERQFNVATSIHGGALIVRNSYFFLRVVVAIANFDTDRLASYSDDNEEDEFSTCSQFTVPLCQVVGGVFRTADGLPIQRCFVRFSTRRMEETSFRRLLV